MTECSPQEVVTALEPLSKSKTQELFFHLGTPLHLMDDIQDGNMYKIRVAEQWINNDLEASWEKLIAGLKKIKMQVLAARIASDYNVVTQSPATSSTAPPPSQKSSSTSQPSVSQATDAIEELEDTYSDLMSDTTR